VLLMVALLDEPTRVLFFTGKGGVGKTSLSCAVALDLAARGRSVLLVSTDPASNLDEVLGVDLGPDPRPVPSAPGLMAANVDPQAAARAYRDRVVGPYRDVLPAVAVASIEEQLSGACTVEIAAFDEFARLIGDPSATAGFDHVVFDTAPTGHTLRLLSLPAAWTGFIDANTTGTSCLGPLAGLQDQQATYEATLAALRDSTVTTLVLVTRPEPTALAEADRASRELAALGVANQQLVVNGVFTPVQEGDPIATALRDRQNHALQALPAGLAGLSRHDLPLLAGPPVGIDALRGLLHPQLVQPMTALPELPDRAAATLTALIDDIEAAGHGVIMTLGKGGVGKTTVAAAIATALARRGHRVHLSTTDPAAHLDYSVGAARARLEVTRIDPVAETVAYTAEVLATAGHDLDAAGRALLEEDLRSPCTEEIAVFRAFARTVALGADQFVVIDTAPTGHTLLLLDAAQAYHRDVERALAAAPDDVRSLLPHLRDQDYTKVLIVTLPEPTPVHEAAALGEDLQRAGISPWAWVINQSFTLSGSTDPVLAARACSEQPMLDEVGALTSRSVLIPWLAVEPSGTEGLDAVLAA
jgi:arsenite-transporting ATPase